jgi:hypothetical protein
VDGFLPPSMLPMSASEQLFCCFSRYMATCLACAASLSAACR